MIALIEQASVIDPAIDFDPRSVGAAMPSAPEVCPRAKPINAPRQTVIPSAVIRPGAVARVRQSALWPPGAAADNASSVDLQTPLILSHR